MTFNRTIVELKLNWAKASKSFLKSFNRTIVELKLRSLHAGHFPHGLLIVP